jgi:hypothetical protein
MSTFAARMLEAKHNKMTARNRGQSIGDHRGTLKPRPLPEKPEWWLEMEFARIAADLAFRVREESETLAYIIAHNNDATFGEIPF